MGAPQDVHRQDPSRQVPRWPSQGLEGEQSLLQDATGQILVAAARVSSPTSGRGRSVAGGTGYRCIRCERTSLQVEHLRRRVLELEQWKSQTKQDVKALLEEYWKVQLALGHGVEDSHLDKGGGDTSVGLSRLPWPGEVSIATDIPASFLRLSRLISRDHSPVPMGSPVSLSATPAPSAFAPSVIDVTEPCLLAATLLRSPAASPCHSSVYAPDSAFPAGVGCTRGGSMPGSPLSRVGSMPLPVCEDVRCIADSESVVVDLVKVGDAFCTRAEWRIESLSLRFRGSMGKPLVSPEFAACGLPSLRLMVFPEPHEARGARNRKSKEKYLSTVTKGPLYGSLKFKMASLDCQAVLVFFLTVGDIRRGPFAYDFSEQGAVYGCEDFGVDWLSQLDGDGARLRVGLELLEVRRDVAIGIAKPLIERPKVKPAKRA